MSNWYQSPEVRDLNITEPLRSHELPNIPYYALVTYVASLQEYTKKKVFLLTPYNSEEEMKADLEKFPSLVGSAVLVTPNVAEAQVTVKILK